MMIMRIINDAAWNIPIYFAVTVSQQNRIGLDQYLDMQGLTFQLKSHKTKPVDADKMYENLMTNVGSNDWSTNFDHGKFYDLKDGEDYLSWSRAYQAGYIFRNLGNDKIFFNQQTQRLLQNYRSAYMQLAVTYYMDFQRKQRKKNKSEEDLVQLKTKIIKTLNRMSENIPEKTIPIQSEDLHYQVARIYGDLGEKESMRSILEQLVDRGNGRPLNRVEYANTFYKELNDIDKAISILDRMREDYLQIEGMVTTRGFNKKSIKESKWVRWKEAYPEIVSSLVYIYRENNRSQDAEVVLSDWVLRNPSDKNAQKILEEVRSGG